MPIKLPHKPRTITDSGADELRCAIIERALNDYEDGIIWDEFVTRKLVENIDGITEIDKTNIYYSWNQTEKFAQDATKFLNGSWCRILAGNLDVSKLVEQTEKNADDKIKIISTPCIVYLGSRKNHAFYKAYDSLFEMQLDIIKVPVTPTYFLPKIKKEEGKNGKRYIEFVSKKKSYYVDLGW